MDLHWPENKLNILISKYLQSGCNGICLVFVPGIHYIYVYIRFIFSVCEIGSGFFRDSDYILGQCIAATLSQGGWGGGLL